MNPKNKTALLRILNKLYPNPKSELNFKNEFELVVSVVLSAQCTDKKVNQVTPILFSQYPDFRTLAKANLADIEKIIRPINYYKTKSKHIIALASLVQEKFNNKLPTTHADLISLPGVGRKTANVVLCEQGITTALPVDTHVLRVSHRLGLAKSKTPDSVEQELMKEFQPNEWHDLHHWLIFHGRRVCKAQRPLCAECSLSALCPSKQ